MKAIFLSCFLCLAHLSIGQGLHVEESQSVLFGADTLGAGVKAMWIPSRAAFRAGANGSVLINGQAFNASGSNSWDLDNLGAMSFATGHGSIASGSYTIAMGLKATASSFHSIAIGSGTSSSNLYSTAIGNGANASGLSLIHI